MEKRISVFIGRKIFSLVKNYRISILIGYTVFLTSEENRILIVLTTWPPCQEGAKLYLDFMSKRRRVSPIKKIRDEKNSFDSLFRRNNGETNGMNLF